MSNYTIKLDSPASRSIILAACLVIVVMGLRAAASILTSIALALFIATLSIPILSWLRKEKFPDGASILVVIFINLSVLMLFGWIITQSIADIRSAMPRYVERFVALEHEVIHTLEQHGITVPRLADSTVLETQRLMDMAGTALKGIAGTMSNFFLIFLVAVFIWAEAAGFRHKVALAFSAQDREGAAWMERISRVRKQIQRYIEIKTLISLATGVTIALALWMLGIDFPVFWGVVAFMLNYVPSVGSIIAAIPAILLALVQVGPGGALVTTGVYVAVNFLFGNILEPQLMGSRLGLSPLIILLSLIFWGWVWGPVGMLLSTPLTMLLKIVLENTEDLGWVAVLLGPSREEGVGG